MVFRLSFFGTSLADGVLFFVQLVTFQIIYGQVDTIAGWTRGQMLIFIGTFSMLNGINLLTVYFGIANIPEKIRNGDLDHYLTKPINPLLRLSFENINPGSIPLLFISGGIIAYGVIEAEINVTFSLLSSYIALTLLMSLLWYDVAIILRTLPFFFISGNASDRLEDIFYELNFKIPGVVYKGIFRAFFYFILPYGIMSTVPTQMLTGTLTTLGLLQALGTVIFFTFFAIWFWRFGLKHYKSASS